MDDDPSKKYVESESSVEDEVFEDETTSRSTRESSPVFYLDPADWPRTHAMQSPVPSPLSQPHRWPLPSAWNIEGGKSQGNYLEDPIFTNNEKFSVAEMSKSIVKGIGIGFLSFIGIGIAKYADRETY